MNKLKASKMLVIVLSVFSLGCGLIPTNPEVAPEFSILYSQFLMDAARYERELDLDSLVVKFGPTDSDTYAYCTGPKTVVINEVSWNDLDRYGKEALLYHELGHCVLGQEHRQNSIMAAVMIRSFAYAADRENYIAELFTHL